MSSAVKLNMPASKNISLRAPEPRDAEIIYRWENDSSIWHLSNTVTPYSLYQIEQFILNTAHDIYAVRQQRFMIDLTENSITTAIGSIDLYDFDPVNLRAGIGILIDEPFRKMNFASTALELLTDYCFGVLKLHQVYCSIADNNEASIRLFVKSGFVLCGKRREWIQINGKWHDEFFYQKLNNQGNKEE
jgi:diamine N-acetyltransferase